MRIEITHSGKNNDKRYILIRCITTNDSLNRKGQENLIEKCYRKIFFNLNTIRKVDISYEKKVIVIDDYAFFFSEKEPRSKKYITNFVYITESHKFAFNQLAKILSKEFE